MVAVLGLTWGGSFLVIEIALTGITPFWLAAGRVGFAAILMILVWWSLDFHLFVDPPTQNVLATVGILGATSTAVPFMLLSWGQQFVTSGFAGVSMASVGLIVLPLAHFFLPGERLTLRRSIGFLIGFLGVCVLFGATAIEKSGLHGETAGRLACLSAACCYGMSSVLMRRLPQVDPIGLASVILVIAACIAVPTALIIEGPPPAPDAMTLLVIAFLGLVPTAAANVLRVLVIRSAGPVFMSITNYQVPAWSMFLGAVLLGEPLPASLFAALALILMGTALSQYGALSRLFPR